MAANKVIDDTYNEQPEVVIEESRQFYYPLNSLKGEIRLLELQKGSRSDLIVGNLHTVELSKASDFIAVSYVWGESNDCRQIWLDSVTFSITTNLHDALRRLRREDVSVLVWADAICINQSDIAERSYQVGLMGKIYKAAIQTSVWLGEVCDDCSRVTGASKTKFRFRDPIVWSESGFSKDLSIIISQQRIIDKRMKAGAPVPRWDYQDDCIVANAIHLLELVAQGGHYDDLPMYIVTDKGKVLLRRIWYDSLRATEYLMTSPWWTRLWTFQEGILSHSSVMVHIGQHQIDMSTIFAAILQCRNQEWDCCLGLQEFWPVLPSWTIVGGYADCFILKETLTLEKLITVTKNRRAKDRRDHIYALFGLLVDPPFPVDYSLNVSEVFAKTVKYFIELEGNLDELAREPRSSCRLNQLPSWVRDFSAVSSMYYGSRPTWPSGPPFDEGETMLNKITNMDLLFLTLNGARLTSVVDSGPARMRSWDTKHFGSKLGDFVTDSKKWLQKINASDNTSRIWRCIFRNIGGNRQHPLSEGYLKRLVGAHRAWVENPTVQIGFSISYMGDKQLASIWPDTGYQLFQCADGSLGIVKPTVEIGDEIWLVKGSNNPLVLRHVVEDIDNESWSHEKETTISKATKKERYLLVGVCYLDELEDNLGENLPWQRIDLI